MKQRENRNRSRYEMEIVPVSSLEEGVLKGSNHRKFKKLNPKSIALILLLLGFSINGFAQFQWGVKLGANASTYSEIGNLCNNSDLRAGFNGGVIAKYQMKDWLALETGVEYQLKGMKCDVSGEDNKLETKLNYMVVPIETEFSASESAGLKNGQRLFLATGPYLGYLLKASQIVHDQTTEIKDINDFDMGWKFELGFEFPLFEHRVMQISLCYDMGIKEVAKDTDVQNKTASINFGLLF